MSALVDRVAPRRRRSALPLTTLLGAAALVAVPSAPALAAVTPPVMRVGALAGPIPVHGGSRLVRVARVPLGAGSWTVLLKGVARSTGTGTGDRLVRCRLGYAGTSVTTLADPTPRGQAASSQAFLLIHAWHLEAPGAATLACTAPGSRTGAVVLERLRAVAFRTDALTTTLSNGQPVTVGPEDAPSQVRLLTAPDVRLGDDLSLVTSMELPAGAWAVTAAASVDGAPGAGAASLFCEVQSGDGGRGYGSMRRTGTAGSRLPLALQMVTAQAGPFTIWFVCSDRPSGVDPWVRGVRIVAYRAMTLDSRPTLSSAPGAAAPPVVVAGHAGTDAAIPSGPAWSVLRRLDLLPGRWVVVAQGTLLRSGDRSAAVGCRLGRSGSFDRFDTRLAGQGTGSAQPLVGVWSGTLASAGAVELSCRSDRPGSALGPVSLVAYQAGTLRPIGLR